ncbi:MAG: hypothetical protein HY934_10240 [Candidatus Firestonebacteria bacterium]|nr:hypothetical protein [Candidatus Firestonebacteria bacterium]
MNKINLCENEKNKLKEYTAIVKSMLKNVDNEKIKKIKNEVFTGRYMKNKHKLETLAEILLRELD